ncbi:MAG: TetR/AcrR family transcriptional regulator, partial [Nitrospirae bacterium]|nr:TetR/AcrR family transcriptional regulator [Candidatus Manganitrophaceae bacterium]
GYEATSMQALEEVMHLKRTSIYNTFGNKRALYRSVLDYYLKTVLSRFVVVMAEAKSAKAAVEAVFQEIIRHNFSIKNPGGCLVVLSVLESHQHDDVTHRILDDILQGMSQAIVERLQEGVDEGELKPETPVRRIGEQVTAMVNGITVMAKAHFSEAHLRELASASTETLLANYLLRPSG